MGSKRFKGKVCVYCGAAPAATMDHVFAREFLPVEHRGNLPKVPACAACNSTKSKLEHYLTTVLPFGGQHADALKVLSEMVPRRLDKNAKLKNVLSSGQAVVMTNENGRLASGMSVPIDSEQVGELFRYITQGLMFHHFGVVLDRKAHGVWAGFLNETGVELHRSLLSLNSEHRVNENVGNGTFVYHGAQGADIPEMSIWVFDVFGGLKLSGDPDDPHTVASVIGGITASAAALDNMKSIIK